MEATAMSNSFSVWISLLRRESRRTGRRGRHPRRGWIRRVEGSGLGKSSDER